MYDDEDIPKPVMPEWSTDERAPYSLYRSRLAFNAKPMRPKELRKMRGVYYGMITYIDHQLGRLFGQLKLDGLWDDTLVVFSLDHGEKLGDFDDLCKSEVFESTARVPYIVKPPESLEGARGVESDALVDLADLYPTFCEVAGADMPDDVKAKSIVPLLTGERDSVRDLLYGQINNSYMLHDGRHKYLYFADDGAELVFDVTHDRADILDLSTDEQLTAELRARFMSHAEQIGSDALVNRSLRSEELVKPAPEAARARNPLAWEVSHWSKEYAPRSTHYVQRGTSEAPTEGSVAERNEQEADIQ